MRKQHLAVCIMLMGLAGFILMEMGRGITALSPFFASRALAGRIIGVDAGHGGYDGGCVGVSGVEEKAINLEVALLLRRELEARGAHVILSRNEDIALIDPKATTGYKKRKELTNRIALFNDAGVEMMVSIHMNRYEDAAQRGAQVFYQNGQTDGRTLALSITQALHDLDGKYTRTASVGDYFILNTCPASALVECGFLSNPSEESLLRDGEYQKKVCAVLAASAADYVENIHIS